MMKRRSFMQTLSSVLTFSLFEQRVMAEVGVDTPTDVWIPVDDNGKTLTSLYVVELSDTDEDVDSVSESDLLALWPCVRQDAGTKKARNLYNDLVSQSRRRISDLRARVTSAKLVAVTPTQAKAEVLRLALYRQCLANYSKQRNYCYISDSSSGWDSSIHAAMLLLLQPEDFATGRELILATHDRVEQLLYFCTKLAVTFLTDKQLAELKLSRERNGKIMDLKMPDLTSYPYYFSDFADTVLPDTLRGLLQYTRQKLVECTVEKLPHERHDELENLLTACSSLAWELVVGLSSTGVLARASDELLAKFVELLPGVPVSVRKIQIASTEAILAGDGSSLCGSVVVNDKPMELVDLTAQAPGKKLGMQEVLAYMEQCRAQ